MSWGDWVKIGTDVLKNQIVSVELLLPKETMQVFAKRTDLTQTQPAGIALFGLIDVDASFEPRGFERENTLSPSHGDGDSLNLYVRGPYAVRVKTTNSQGDDPEWQIYMRKDGGNPGDPV